MKALEDKILKEGTIREGNILKVDNFLNHQIDSEFMMQIGEEIASLYAEDKVTKVLTIEASGIAIALAAASKLGVPMIFAKKHRTKNLGDSVYKTEVHSYTHGTDYTVAVSMDYINESDRVLIVDDFLATGNALKGLVDLAKQAGADVCGFAIAIEKGFQKGGDNLREEGYRVESLAIVEHMDGENIIFR